MKKLNTEDHTHTAAQCGQVIEGETQQSHPRESARNYNDNEIDDGIGDTGHHSTSRQ